MLYTRQGRDGVSPIGRLPVSQHHGLVRLTPTHPAHVWFQKVKAPLPAPGTLEVSCCWPSVLEPRCRPRPCLCPYVRSDSKRTEPRLGHKSSVVERSQSARVIACILGFRRIDFVIQ